MHLTRTHCPLPPCHSPCHRRGTANLKVVARFGKRCICGWNQLHTEVVLLPSVTLTDPKHTSWSHVGFKPSGNFISDNIAKVTKVTLGPSKHYHMTSALLKNKTKKQVVISAVGEVGPGGSQIQDQPGVHRESLPQVSKPTNVKQCYVPPVTLRTGRLDLNAIIGMDGWIQKLTYIREDVRS